MNTNFYRFYRCIFQSMLFLYFLLFFATATSAQNLSVSLIVTNDVTCHGGQDGEIQAHITGAIQPYSIQWSNNNSSYINSNLEAGTYTITVTSGFNSLEVAQASVVLAQPTQMYIDVSTTPESAPGANDGTATVINVIGGSGSYSYNWMPHGGSGATAGNLSAGSYQVLVYDNFLGCEVEKSVTVHGTNNPTISVAAALQPSCHNSADGSLTVATSGLTAPINYWWSPYGGFQATANNLTAGIYTVYAMDAKGNYIWEEVELTGPAELKVIPTSTNLSCHSNNGGQIDLNVSGGTAPYNYDWSPANANSPTISGLSTGYYQCEVTDVNGCSVSSQLITVSQSFLPMTVSANVIKAPTCSNTANGMAEVEHLGGQGPYTYFWMPSGQTSAVATNLATGLHTVTVTDAMGCEKTASVNVLDPNNALTGLNAITQDISCLNSSNGAISVSPIGGDAPFSYLWSTNAASDSNAFNLSDGTYTITVLDANGCTASTSASINLSNNLNEEISTTDNLEFCAGESATLHLTSIAGNSYKWLKYSNYTGDTSLSITVTKSGNYSAEVTTPDGCTYITNKIKVKKLANPTVSLDKSGFIQFCANKNVELIATYNSGLKYQWYKYSNAISGATSNILKTNSNGKYYVNVMDVNGCIGKSNSVRLKKLKAFTVDVIPQSATTFCKGSNVLLDAVVSGGSAPYSYKWYIFNNQITGQTNSTLKVDRTGGYKVYVTDANGCEYSNSGRIKVNVNCRLASESFDNTSNNLMKVYPNPFNNKLSINLPFIEDEETEISLTDIYGRVVHLQVISSTYNYELNVDGLETGYYILQVKQGKMVQRLKVWKQ